MEYTERVTSQDFREEILNYYPILRTNRDYLSLTEYLLFSTWKDERSGKLVIPWQVIGELLRKDYKNRNFQLEKLLFAYKRDVTPTLSWSNYVARVEESAVRNGRKGSWVNTNRRVRIITDLQWPQIIQDALKAELNIHWKDSPRVYFSSGLPYSRRKALEIANQEREEALRLMAAAKILEAKELLELMNNVSPLKFYKLIDNIHDTIKLANNIALHHPEETDEMTEQLKLLNAIYSQHQPYYKPVDASTRIFSIGEGLPYLDRRLRAVLTRGWIECDLSNAQVAIAAKLWNVPIVIEFLKDRKNNIWNHLFEVYDMPYDEAKKRIFKTAVYAMMYGMKKSTRNPDSNSLMTILEGVGGGKNFFKSPLIRAMYEARNEQMDRIIMDKGGRNCFGQWLHLKQFPKDVGFSRRSILAQQSQAYELKLLYPVVQLAKRNTGKNGFTVVLWQHDGFSMVANRTSRTKFWMGIIQRRIDYEAYVLDIPTHFETKS